MALKVVYCCECFFVNRLNSVIVKILLKLDLIALLVIKSSIKAESLKLFEENLKCLRCSCRRNVFALNNCLIGLNTADNIVRLNGDDFLKGVGCAVSFKSPNLHLTETLTAELCLTAERLLSNKAVRTC